MFIFADLNSFISELTYNNKIEGFSHTAAALYSSRRVRSVTKSQVSIIFGDHIRPCNVNLRQFLQPSNSSDKRAFCPAASTI